MHMAPVDLLTYCGSYGGSCARYKVYKAFRTTANIVAEIVDSHGFQYWMSHKVNEFDYIKFRKSLELFRSENSWLVCKCCKGGGGGPLDCPRECCIERLVDVCFECGEYICDEVKEDVEMLKVSEEYLELSRDEWLRRQEEKAQRGYENHAKKYYQINVG